MRVRWVGCNIYAPFLARLTPVLRCNARRFMAEIDRELLNPIGADMTMFKVIKEKTTRREQYLRDVKVFWSLHGSPLRTAPGNSR